MARRVSKSLTFTRIPGSARHYLGSNGRDYTRRQRDNYLARKAGFSSMSQLERVREREFHWAGQVRKRQGHKPTWEEYHYAKIVEDERKALLKKHGGVKPEPHIWSYDFESDALTDPDGALANYLDLAGIREKNGKPVGSS